MKLLAGGLALTEAINLGAIMLTAYTAPATLRQVSSLSQLVGSAPVFTDTGKRVPVPPGVRVVVMGDSTAAGDGLPWVRDASQLDKDCGRSSESYAEDLARSNGWQVMNLACNSATIRQGLLGPEGRGGETAPPQMDAAQRARHAAAVIVSVGADDLDWSAMLRLCAAAKTCNDKATTAYFQQQLASFSKDYLELLSQLAGLPGHPEIIINRYYDPFGPQLECLSKVGVTAAKVRTLSSRLAALNAVLAKGATQFGFTSVQPDFAGHELCTPQPYVQGLGDLAPFHPTALGQLAIALADQAALSLATMPGSAAVATPSATASPSATPSATPSPSASAGPPAAPSPSTPASSSAAPSLFAPAARHADRRAPAPGAVSAPRPHAALFPNGTPPAAAPPRRQRPGPGSDRATRPAQGPSSSASPAPVPAAVPEAPGGSVRSSTSPPRAGSGTGWPVKLAATVRSPDRYSHTPAGPGSCS